MWTPRTPAGFQHVPRDEKQTLVGQVFSSVAGSYDIMNDLMSGGASLSGEWPPLRDGPAH